MCNFEKCKNELVSTLDSNLIITQAIYIKNISFEFKKLNFSQRIVIMYGILSCASVNFNAVYLFISG
jgi:hypothetical protein